MSEGLTQRCPTESWRRAGKGQHRLYKSTNSLWASELCTKTEDKAGRELLPCIWPKAFSSGPWTSLGNHACSTYLCCGWRLSLFKYKVYIIWMAKAKEQLEYQMQCQSLALPLGTVQMCCWGVFTTIPQAIHVVPTCHDLQMLQRAQCRASPAPEEMWQPKTSIYFSATAWLFWFQANKAVSNYTRQTYCPSLCQPWNLCIISSAHSHMLPSCLLCQLWLYKICS